MEGESSTQEGSSSTYEKIMGIATAGEEPEGGGAHALSNRLATFRQWATEEANITVHPSICIVNGEATDGTKNAPVLAFGPPPGSQPLALAPGQGRVGMVDGTKDRALYERTIGCQVRTAKEIKKDEVMMTVPRAAMITPDVVASSDAGRAVLACCKALPQQEGETGFWDTFGNTSLCERMQSQKAKSSNGTQLLVKILQERKRAESAYIKATRDEAAIKKELAPPGAISTRAPMLAFLIQQRFAPNARPPVASDSNGDFVQVLEADGDANALRKAKIIPPLDGAPETFAPYARALPSSVTLPICWKRNELALLSGCITGISPLQEIAATTLQLVSEFVALVDAGILSRFPSVFPPGVLTWERWVWAAAVFTSRVLPASCYLNEGEPNAAAYVPGEDRDLQSPREVWDELGVLVPILDMLNHEIETHQVTWEQNVPKDSMIVDDPSNDAGQEPHPPRAVMHKRVRKGQQVYTCYGNLSNRILMLQYGFCQMVNSNDETRLGWGLMDAVGNVPPSADYTPLFEVSDDAKKFQVYESTEPIAVNDWWSDERLELLELEVAQNVENSFMSSLKIGKKMTGAAHSDGTYDPILLTTALVGTMPIPELTHHMAKRRSVDDERMPITISQRHQEVLRAYLGFIFSQKLQKLLENLDNGLKGHFGGVRLWTKASQGGIRYKKAEEETEETQVVGWQTFFDEHAYTATMEVEKHYYAIGPDSCVLTLYDGQLQALQATLDGLLTSEKFEDGVIRQLQDLGFKIGNGDEKIPDEIEIKQDPENGNVGGQGMGPPAEKQGGKRGDDKKKEDGKSPKKSRRNRKRNNSAATGGSDRPPAIKLHIGNLSYSTLADDLYNFFARESGRDNILECHIPTERETGKSRGFGFVTLPENIARQILTSQKKYELDGRILKIAESNSAGSNKPNRVPPRESERCSTCGYRPKYCVCAAPNLPGMPSNGPPGPDYGREYDYYGSSRHRRDRYSRSRSPYHRDRGRRSREADHPRDHSRDSRDRRHYYDRSRSRSYSRGRDRDRRERRRDRKSRDRSRDRDRSRERSRELSKERSRDRSKERSRERSRDRSRERSMDRSRDRRDRHSRRRSYERSRGSRHSRSRSPSYSRKERGTANGEAAAKGDVAEERPEGVPDATKPSAAVEEARPPDSRKRRSSRSRSRGRSRKSRKKKRHARSRSRSVSPGSPV